MLSMTNRTCVTLGLPKARRSKTMKILIYAEHRDGQVRKITYENLTLARQLGQPFEVAVIGSEADGLADELGKYGAEKVLFYKKKRIIEH